MKIKTKFIKIPKVILTSVGEHRKKKGVIVWFCNQCETTTSVQDFVKGRIDMVKMLANSETISATYGRFYLCPYCYSIMYSVGRGDYAKIDTDYKENLMFGCDVFKRGNK